MFIVLYTGVDELLGTPIALHTLTLLHSSLSLYWSESLNIRQETYVIKLMSTLLK